MKTAERRVAPPAPSYADRILESNKFPKVLPRATWKSSQSSMCGNRRRHRFWNIESPQARQYALADQAIAFGWPRERVLIIDEDLGKSGRTAEGRSGFQRLISEVT